MSLTSKSSELRLQINILDFTVMGGTFVSPTPFCRGNILMEAKTIVTFIKAAELGSFSRTANVLGYSQAAVTVQIKQLED